MNKKNVTWFVNNFEEVTGATLLLLMASLAFLNVLTRYFIMYSLAFTEELEVASMVWLTMLGTAAAFKRGAHLKFVFLESRVSPRARFFLALFSFALGLVLFTAIAFLSYFHLRDLIELNVTTEALDIPESIYVMAIPLGSVLINIRIIQLIRKLLRERRSSWE
ncbi:MAG TPA: TRAP transporter small permease [Deltaproteobacteria bacterium]|nr:TRAP transporter small permease [Deltaproteobacteria bacterium]